MFNEYRLKARNELLRKDAGTCPWGARGQTSFLGARGIAGIHPDLERDDDCRQDQSGCHQPADTPPAGQVYYYLNRAAAPAVGSWGKDSSGAVRNFTCP